MSTPIHNIRDGVIPSVGAHAQVTEAHKALWTKLYNLAYDEIFDVASSDGPATQLIADSEAAAIAAAFPDSGDDSLYNVRRLRAEVRKLQEQIGQQLAACDCAAMMDTPETHEKNKTVTRENPFWSNAFESVMRRTAECIALRAEVERLNSICADHYAAHSAASQEMIRLGLSGEVRPGKMLHEALARAEKAEAELAKERAQFPSDRAYPIVEVFSQEGDPVFVSGINGATNGDMVAQIERDLNERRGFMDKGDGRYLYRVVYESAQTDHEGRIELPGYWDLSLVAFAPLTEELK